MKIDNFYLVGVIFVFVGICIQIISLYTDAEYLFNGGYDLPNPLYIGIGLTGIGIIFLGISIIKNYIENIRKRKNE